MNKSAFNPKGLPKIRSIIKPMKKLDKAYKLLGKLKDQKQKIRKPNVKLR